MSDLHLDVGGQDARFSFRLPVDRPKHDAVIIAGDICEDAVKAVRWIANAGFKKPVLFVPGNHEFYRKAIDKNLTDAAAEAALHDHIHLLHRDVVVIGGVRFIGVTMWTDYELMGDRKLAMLHARQSMNDHRMIRYASKGYRRWLPEDCAEEHRAARDFLDVVLGLPFHGPTVVVTHHAPSIKSVHERYNGDLLNSAFASHMDDFVDRAKLWVHGHIHHAVDYRIGDGRVICNPRGYAYCNESTGFDPVKVVDVSR